MKTFDVLSFDPDRVKLDVTQGGKVTIRKTTSETEFQNIIRAHEYITEHPLELDLGSTKIHLSPVSVIEWERSSSVLVTEYIRGDTLEHILREHDHPQRKEWIALLRQLVSKFRLSGFLWGDLAPRNMIYSREECRIAIFDFEREQTFQSDAANTATFSRYLRSYPREEFSCFLLKGEQDLLFAGFLTKEVNGCMHISEISSSRKRALLKMLSGEKEVYSIEEVERIEDDMAYVATPFFVGNTLFHPMDILEKIGSKGSPEAYASAVKRIRNLGEEERFDDLSKSAKVYK
jgi:tRNA A-37 threonylcarbamoyl transferase component Bud32